MQAKGDFGERHIHKKPLELPIPKFKSSSKKHMQLVTLGKNCTKLANDKLPKLDEKYQSIGKIRSIIRKNLKDKLKKIDELVYEFHCKKRIDCLVDSIGIKIYPLKKRVNIVRKVKN